MSIDNFDEMQNFFVILLKTVNLIAEELRILAAVATVNWMIKAFQ